MRNNFIEANSNKFYLFTLSLILVSRWYYRLIHATLWAEDGEIFLHDAIEHGVKSIFFPYAGYFHTVPRIISYFASLFPTIYIPHIIVIFCLVITYYVISVLLKKDYEWVVPNVHFRGVMLLLIALAPGTTEAYGNIANIHWVLYLYLGLLALRSVNYKFNTLDLTLASLAVFSEGAAITLLPLFLIRLLFHVINKRTKRLIFQESYLIIIILIMSIINFLNKTTQTSFDIPILSLAQVFIKSTLAESISFSWLYILPYTLFEEYWFIPSIALTAIAGFFIFKSVSLREYTIILFVFFCCLWLLPPMTVMARGSTGNILGLVLTHNDLGWNPFWWLNFRYAFLPSISGYIFWIWVISLIFKHYKKVAVLLSIIILSLNFYYCLDSYYFIRPYSENKWIKNSKKIDAVRNNSGLNSIEIPIEPGGWKVIIGKGDIIVDPD